MTSSSASQQSLYSTMSSISTSQRHLQSVKPVFIKDKDIGDSSTTPLFMCNAITRVISSSKLDGVQRINNLWRIYLKDNATRLDLTVKQEIKMNGKSVPLYDQNPYDTYPGLPVQKKMNSDKLTIRNLPLSVSNDEIEKMLVEKSVVLRSPIRYGYIRNEDGELTTYKSGDRYVFVEPFETPLPRQQEIRIFQCLVLHHRKNGPPCKSCGVQGHKPGDDACKAKPKTKILAFRGYQHPLSNHYPCKLSVYDMEFKSLEAAFFYRMATEFNKTQLAEVIRGAKHAGIVKTLSKDIAEDEDRWKWEEDNTQVMVHLLNAKLDQCPEFRQCLIDNVGLVFAEATPSRIWGTGLSPYITERTSAEYWLGRNLLGAILTELSQKLVDGATLSSSSMDSGSIELCGQDTSLENHEHLLHSGQQLTSAVLSDLGSQPESQSPHQGDNTSLMPPTCPPASNEPAVPTANQSTEASSNLSTDESTNRSTDQTSSTLTSEQLSSQSTQLSLDTTHTQQSVTEDTGDATTTYSAHNSRPKQRIPAVHRSSRSYSASRTSRTPSRKSCHSVKTVDASTPDIRTVLKGEKHKEPSSSPDHIEVILGKVQKADNHPP